MTRLRPKPKASQGDTVLVSVMWQVLAPVDKNYSVAAVLLAPDGRVLARRETYPSLGLRPTRYLAPGNSFVDVYPLKLTGDVAEPLVARAVVNLFDFDSANRAGFPALNEKRQEVTPSVGQIKITPKTWPIYQPQQIARVNFNQTIALTGYDLSPDKLRLTLYWESLAPGWRGLRGVCASARRWRASNCSSRRAANRRCLSHQLVVARRNHRRPSFPAGCPWRSFDSPGFIPA